MMALDIVSQILVTVKELDEKEPKACHGSLS